jgi:hypothetical protein
MGEHCKSCLRSLMLIYLIISIFSGTGQKYVMKRQHHTPKAYFAVNLATWNA